jgi:hypothetical protein
MFDGDKATVISWHDGLAMPAMAPLLMVLVDQGELALDDPIAKYPHAEPSA